MAPLTPFPLLQATVRSVLGLPALPRVGAPQPVEGDLSESRKGRSRALRSENRESGSWPDRPPRPLSTEDIRRWLLRFRFDPEFRGQRRVPIKVLAEIAGLHRDSLYEVVLRRRASLLVRAKLSPAVNAIAVGQLRFRRRKQIWTVEGSIFSPSIDALLVHRCPSK
jgi:hypothetical protein